MVQFPKWQTILVVGLLVLGVLLALPNALDRKFTEGLPGWLPNKQVSLGLDLRGGSYLLYEADIDAVFTEQLEGVVDSLRLALRRERIGFKNLRVQGTAARVSVDDPAQYDTARALAREVAGDMLISLGDDGQMLISLGEQDMIQRGAAIMEQAIEIIRLRVDELGTREASIQRQGDRRVLVQVPGFDDPERLKSIIGKTAKLAFRFVHETAIPGDGRPPAGTEVLRASRQRSTGEPARYVVQRRVMVSGENLVDAQPSFQNNQPVVSFRFDAVGGKRFAEATRKNVGRPFAIVLDNEVISAPVIREPILGGSGVISGSFTVQQVQDLALLLRAGALPAPLAVIEERTVGPGLGHDSIRAGQIASILGLILVVVFMAATYGTFGLMADVALLANLILILAILSALQATLTLPGIGGIVLTIGMAVDANVLIFERIREEAHEGRGPVAAIDAGYKRAMTTIFDSNLTTLIAAVLLFQFGSGPVKGFAVTLTIGLITSMFTAIMVTRLMVVIWLRRRRPSALPI